MSLIFIQIHWYSWMILSLLFHILMLTSRSGACAGTAPERLDRRVKSICLLNVVIKQGILINTHKTKQAMCCRVTCNRVPFIARYCVFIQVMTQHWQFENYLQKNKCFTDFRIAMPPRTSVSKDVGNSSICRMNSTQSALLATRKLCLDTDLSHDVSRPVAVTSHRVHVQGNWLNVR